jgi:zinc-binding alcohol dehydrogenase/oxidoreductase
MLQLVNDHQIVPIVDEVFPLANTQKAVDKMGSSSQFGKLVISI